MKAEEIRATGDYVVVFQYDPGTPKTYRVCDAPSASAARRACLDVLGYNPGVSIYVRDYRKGDTADYVVEYSEAGSFERMELDYHDSRANTL